MTKKQLHECSCGTLTDNDFVCPDCSRRPFPVWTVHTPAGRCVGYVLGYSEADAIESVRQTPAFDNLALLEVWACYNSPEIGPIAPGGGDE